MKYYVRVDGEEFEIVLEEGGRVLVNGSPVEVDFVRIPGQNVYSLLVDHHSYEIAVEETRRGYRILLQGHQYEAEVEDERYRRLMAGRSQPAPTAGLTTVVAPIPGLIVRVEVEEGQEVKAGQPLVILQAMKMENEIRAPQAGVVRQVHVRAGENVEQGATLVTLG